MTAKGHATGSVEACAGVSALMCALAGHLGEDLVGVRLESGDVQVEARERRGMDRVKTAVELVTTGLKMMEKQYGPYIRVEEGRADDTRKGHAESVRRQSRQRLRCIRPYRGDTKSEGGNGHGKTDQDGLETL